MRPRMNTEKSNMTKEEKMKSYKNLFSSMKKYFPYIIVSIICTIISVVISILAPQWLSDLSNVITSGAANSSIDMNEIQRIAIVLIVFYVVNALLSFISGIIMNYISQRYSYDLRESISLKINRMPLRYFDTHQYGDTLSRVTNDVDTIGQSLQQSITMLINSVFMLIGVLIAMFITSWQMAFTALITLPLMGVMLVVIMKFAIPLFRLRQQKIGEVNGIVEENFSGQLIIKAFNAEDTKEVEFDKENNELCNTMFKAQFFGGIMQPMMSFVSYFAYAAVCIVGGLLMANDKGVTFGTITAFLVYVNLFQNPLSQIAQAMNQVQMGVAASSRVFEFINEEELDDEGNKTLYLEPKDVKGSIDFINVRFGYTEDKIIIPDFTCHVKPGMKVAIVGPTGAGKTTIVNLLMRFYEINSGDILIDGISIKDLTRSNIRDIFGMVLQDTWMFEGTLRENIVYNKENVSDEEVNAVIDEANLHHYVETLSHGVDTIIKEDSSLSTGQKQLVTIARAMIENAPLLILDEATSNVDTRTEILIQNAMDKLTEGRTSFVIAHRLSTIKNADLILVLKDGNIIEQGTHDELLSKNGFYSELYNSQFAEEE